MDVSNLNLLTPGSGNTAETNQFRDIRPPVDIPSGWEWLWWTLATLLLLALLGFLWRWWQRRRKTEQQVPSVPPHVRARRRLEGALRLIPYPREFCIEVSDTLRIYLEERFSFRAPERTTEEFLHELQETTLLASHQKSRLTEFLEACDLVKFARFEPAEAELRSLHHCATTLVEETVPPKPAADRNLGPGQAQNATQNAPASP